MKSPLPRLVLAICALVLSACGAAPSLKVGDLAPKLQTGQWIQGEPIHEFTTGKAYLIEFWATWCGVLRPYTPHLNTFATKFENKGLIVLAQNVWEHDESAVAPFIKKMGDKMTYRVALDDMEGTKNGKMAETWLTAAKQSFLPIAFLVDTQGRIAWIGYPKTLPEKTVTDVLAGKYDLEAAAALYLKEKEEKDLVDTAWYEIGKAVKTKKWDVATTKLKALDELFPADKRADLPRLRLEILLHNKEYPAAYQLIAKMGAASTNQPLFQNALAWRILTDPTLEQRDLALAERLAVQANTTTGGKEEVILKTLARALFMQDKRTEAILIQKKAVAIAESDIMKKDLKATLKSYRKGELPEAN